MNDEVAALLQRPVPDTLDGCREYIHALRVAGLTMSERERELEAEATRQRDLLAQRDAEVARNLELLAERDAEAARQRALLAERDAEAARQRELLAEREALIEALRKQIFGRRSEKSREKPAEPTDEEIKEESRPPKTKKEHKGGGRDPLPPHLPRVTTVVDLPDDQKICKCCGKPLKCIRVEESEKLDARPIELFVRRIERPVYACGTCKEGVVQAPMPSQTLPRTGVTAGLATLLMLWKYEDHLPLNRLERILGRSGVDLDRGRMCEWLMAVADLVDPLVDLMERRILASGYACADETHLQMQASGKTKRCWLWASRGLDTLAPYTVFRFSETRGYDGLPRCYDTFNGRLMTDAYSVYDKKAREHPGITLHGCMVHARRKFVAAVDTGDKTAQEAVDLIGPLYEVEDLARDLPPDRRRELRLERSAPQLERIRTWLGQHADAVPKSPLGKAVSYALDRWACIVRVLEDGHMPLDNNALERSIRAVALGRKNWLFAGSPRGGKAAATFFSLIDSCKRSGHNTFEYISDILTRIGDHPVNRLEELLPDNWKTPAPSTPTA